MTNILSPATLTLFNLAFAALLVYPAPNTEKAPPFSLKKSDGETITLSSLRGKVVILNFWATWCGPCRAEIPGFVEVYQQYKLKGLEIVGVALDSDGWKAVTPFVEKYDIKYTVVMGDEETIQRYGGINAIPTTVIIDRKGDIVARHVGYMSKGDLINALNGLLQN